jgi:hypothetical protein
MYWRTMEFALYSDADITKASGKCAGRCPDGSTVTSPVWDTPNIRSGRPPHGDTKYVLTFQPALARSNMSPPAAVTMAAVSSANTVTV